MSEACDHGITLAAYVEVCAECGDEVIHRPPEEANLRAELERLKSGQWTDEERRHFLFEATKASYGEGVRAGCEELSMEAARMADELERMREEVALSREQALDRYRDRNRARNRVTALEAELYALNYDPTEERR